MPISFSDQTWLAITNVWKKHQDGQITAWSALAKIHDIAKAALAVIEANDPEMFM